MDVQNEGAIVYYVTLRSIIGIQDIKFDLECRLRRKYTCTSVTGADAAATGDGCRAHIFVYKKSKEY